MKVAFLRLSAITLIFFLSACRAEIAAESAPIELAAESPSPSASPQAAAPTLTPVPPTPTIEATPTLMPLPNPQYVISAQVDYGWHRVAAAQSIIIPNAAAEPFNEIVLIVQPNWYPGGFQLNELTWGDGTPITDYTLEGIELRIVLEQPLAPGEQRNLNMTYDLALPPIGVAEDHGPIPFGYTVRQTNVVDWYPYLPPYQEDTGWVVHQPWFYGEHLVYPIADFDVALEVFNAPESLTIAASALDTGDETLHRYQLKNSRNFVFSLSPSYQVFEGQVGDTTVLGYAFTYDYRAGQAAFDTTLEALALYAELFHPYEQPVMTLIEADFLHGMEYQNLYFLSRGFYNTYDGTKSSFLVSIAAHETAHQWWYALVGNDQAIEPWLDEAFCTYSELLFYENLYPEVLDSWWWPQRVELYQPSGWVDLNLYNSGGYRPYRDAVYFEGAYFLHNLRTLMGDELFFAFLQEYVAMYAGEIATTEGFFRLLSAYTAADLSGLRAEYFEKAP